VPPEFIESEAGLFVDVTPNMVRAALQSLVDSPEDRQRLGMRARRVVENNFTSARMIRDVGLLYERLLGTPHRKGFETERTRKGSGKVSEQDP